MKKRTKEVKFRHKVVKVVAKIILLPFIKIKYKFKYKNYRKLKKQGPFLILGNHTVAMDPILMGLSFPFRIYYIASEQIFNLGFLSKLLVYAVNPISKSKAASDVAAIRKSKKIVDEGGSIAVYPEGNVTYDGTMSSMSDAIVKMIRLLKIDVIIYTSEGLYLSDPRWSVYRKKGKSSSKIARIIKKEEYDELTNDELFELIKVSLYTNAYDQQKENLQRYRGKQLAKGLERLIFMDLKTNIPFVTYSEGSELKSTASDFKLVYDEYGYVTTNEGEKKTLVDMNEAVLTSYLKYYQNTKESLLFSEEVNVEITTRRKKDNKGRNKLEMHKSKLILSCDNKEFELLYDNISISIQGKKKIIINGESETYLITFDLNSSPYKYLLTHQIYTKEKENESISIRQLGL